MIKPPPFQANKTIGIVALAGPMETEKLLQGEAFLKEKGYNVLIAPSCFESNRYLAGKSDAERAFDLKMMFANDEIGAILNMRGGYGSNRLMPYIKDFNFSRYPKPFIGYSDITYLHVYLNQYHNLITYHGPMLADLLQNDPATFSGFKDIFLGGQETTRYTVNYLNPLKSFGTTLGTSIGGNLSILASGLGTPFEVCTKDKIIFLEEVNEASYQLDRLLMQLKYAGKFNACAGVLLGDFSGDNQDGQWETLYTFFKDFDKPVAFGLSAGHTIPNLTIPLGASCELDVARGKVVFRL